MGERDIRELDYLADNRRFADLVNGVLFEGRQIISEDELKEANSELLFPWTKKGKRVVRDVVKRFAPVVTLVVYYGKEKWDAATNLYEMLDFGGYETELKQYVSDYRINVFDYHDYDNFGMFATELNQVFSFVKCSHNKRQLKNLIAENRDFYYNVDRETAEFIATITNTKSILEGKEDEIGGINMCRAFEEMWEEGLEQGIEQGIKALVEICQDFGLSKEETVSKVIQKFDVKTMDVQSVVGTYWR